MKKGNPMNDMTNGMEKGFKKLVNNIKKVFQEVIKGQGINSSVY